MSVPPANSRYLSAFAIDLQHHLEQTGLFSRIQVRKTGLPQRALIVICSLSDGTQTQEEVARILEKVWHEAPIPYEGSTNSHKITTLTGEVQFVFAIADEVSVTGLIEVLGFK